MHTDDRVATSAGPRTAVRPTPRPRARRAALTAAVAALALTACTSGQDEPAPAPSSTGSDAAPPAPTAVGSPAPLADLGSRANKDGLSVTLTGVHRISDDIGLVSARLTAGDANFNASDNSQLHEPGYDTGAGEVFSAVTVTVDGDDTLYQPVRDADGACLCSTLPGFTSGNDLGAWSYVTLPAGAGTVNVTVGGSEPWVGVPVT